MPRCVLIWIALLGFPALSAEEAGRFAARVRLEGNVEMAVDGYLPDGKKPAPVVLIAHGFTQSGAFHANQARRLAKEGYVVLVPTLARFANHAGHGKDLIALLDWADSQRTDPKSPLHGRVLTDRAAVCGHSAGGLSALLAAAADKRFRVLVLLDAVDWQGMGAKAAAGLKIPVLSVCAEPSEWNANGSPLKLAAAIPEPKRTVRIPGANHMDAQDPANRLGEWVVGKADPAKQARFTAEMVEWIHKHLPETPG